MKRIIHRISQREEIIQRPPVLIDIGASGNLNPIWKNIASFSIGIAFDADDREFGYVEKENSFYKKLYVFNSIVTSDNHRGKQKFYLTKCPYCSSALRPLTEELSPFLYSGLFKVEKVIELNSVALNKVLDEIGIDRIDWFKTDSQGTDLRLFRCLGQELRRKVIIAEFEPGFIDSYEDEDNMLDVMNYMGGLNFYLSDLDIKGPIRMSSEYFNKIFQSKWQKKIANLSLKIVPGWGEISYMNNLDSTNMTSREYLLGWLFATLKKHHGAAYSIAHNALVKFSDGFFDELKNYSVKKMKFEILSPKVLLKMVKHFQKR